MLFDLSANTNLRRVATLDPDYPKNVSVKAGTDAVFSVIIKRDGRPTEYTYKWYVNDTLVSDATTAVYTRDTTSDKGTYSVYCEVINKVGMVKTRVANMQVNTLPVLNSSYPANASVTVGSSVTLSVSISTHGYPQSYTYQWYKNGSKISGATSSSYKFTPSALGKTTFYCKVTNSAGTVTSRTATITPRLYLYKSGDLCTSLTGGWDDEGYRYDDNSPAGDASHTSTYLQCMGRWTESQASHEGCNGTQKAISLKAATTLYADCYTTSATTHSRLYVSTKQNYLMDGLVASKYLPETRSTISINVSSLTGSYYICFGASFLNKATSRVYNMWLE